MKSFLHIVTENLIARVGLDNLRDYAMVFPMQRAGVFMKAELSASAAQMTTRPVMAPEFMTIDSLVNDLSQLEADDELLSIAILHKRFCELNRLSLPLDVFYGWGAQLRTDFSNIDMALIDADNLFRNSMEAHQLERLDMDETVLNRLSLLFDDKPATTSANSYKADYERIWASLPELYRTLNETLRVRHQGYSGARLRWVVEHREEVLLKLAGKHFAFVGFNYLHKGEFELMKLIQDNDPQTLFYWDYNPSFTTNDDAYRFIREHLKTFPNAIGVTPAHSPINAPMVQESAVTPNVNVIATSGASAQARYVHDWLLAHPTGQTGIVIADEALLEQVIYALPPDTTANITKGYPLRSTKVYADINTYMEDEAHTLASLLESGILSPPKTAASEFPSESQSEPEMTWTQLLTAESVYQARKRVERLLFLLNGQELTGLLTPAVIRNLLRRVLDTVTLPFHGDPKTSIQIIGVLETRLLDFDNLLILNVEEGVIPKANKDISFIPYYLRKYYNMETHDESAAAYAYNFFRLLRRPDNITLMFAQASAGSQQKNMSRFLMQILTSSDFTVTKSRIVESTRIISKEVSVNMQAILDWHQKGYIAPSAINTYMACPRQFYLQEIEHIREKQPPSDVMPANVLGSLVHATIQQAYTVLMESKKYISELTDPQIDELLTSVLPQAYAQFNSELRNGETPYEQDEHEIENHVILSQARNVLKKDATYDSLEILSMEQWNEYTLSVETFAGSRTIRVRGKIDRVDRVVQNGVQTTRVLDYKTGTPTPSNKDYNRQTQLYCLMGHEDATPVLMFTRSGVVVEVPQDPDFKQYIEGQIQTIYQDQAFLKVAESPCKSNQYCPFKTICHRPVV